MTIHKLLLKWENELKTTGHINHASKQIIKEFINDLENLEREPEKAVRDLRANLFPRTDQDEEITLE